MRMGVYMPKTPLKRERESKRDATEEPRKNLCSTWTNLSR